MTAPDSSIPAWLLRARELARRTARTVRDSLVLAEHAVKNAAEIVKAVDRDSRAVAHDAVALWRATADAAREMQARAQATPRVARVLSEMVRLATAYRLHHLKAAFLSDERAEVELQALHAREAARVRALCEELGGGILKVGQFVSCRADLLPAAWLAELSQLQDRVPADAPDAVRALLEEELGRTIEEVFASFEVEPIAAASLAQVHRATTLDGRPVAVKIQRPGIAQVIGSDRRALALLADLLGPILPGLDAKAVATELARSLEAELDYRAEAAHAAAFRAALSGIGVAVPEIDTTLSTGRVLVMELVAGERLVDFVVASYGRDATEERERVLASLARSVADAVLVHGLVHADPHPGNFLVRPGGELVLLDFGAVTVLTEDERRAYVELMPVMFAGDMARMLPLLTRLGFSAPDPEVPAIYAREVIGRVLASNDLSGIDPRAELERGLAIARDHPGLVVPGHFVQLGRSLAGLSGLFLVHAPTLQLGKLLLETVVRASRQA